MRNPVQEFEAKFLRYRLRAVLLGALMHGYAYTPAMADAVPACSEGVPPEIGTLGKPYRVPPDRSAQVSRCAAPQSILFAISA